MAEPSKHQSILISTLLLATIGLNLPRATLSDTPCIYPCYPPPTGTTTPVPGVVSYTPPVDPNNPGGSYPYPYTPPPPNYDGGYYGAPPPPDPILPYFPFYFKEPLHGQSPPSNGNQPSLDGSSSTRSTTLLLPNLSLLLLFFFFLY